MGDQVKVKLEMIKRITRDHGFIAALDQSGGSTPSALKRYGVSLGLYEDADGMFDYVHDMRSRLIKDDAFNKQFNITMVYVTHDQLEASTFADKIAVMYGGQIVQFGTPRELFERPNHAFVGYFIGSPGMNLVEVERWEGGVVFNSTRVPLDDSINAILNESTSTNIKIGIRPEFVHVWEEPTDGAFECNLKVVEDLGTYKILTIELDGVEFKARIEEDAPVPAQKVYISFPEQWLKVYLDEYLVDPNFEALEGSQ